VSGSKVGSFSFSLEVLIAETLQLQKYNPLKMAPICQAPLGFGALTLSVKHLLVLVL
jgi:hypothetical protein